jgi:PAS domain S-box-containing protein
VGIGAALIPLLFVEALRNLGFEVAGPGLLFLLGIVFAAFFGGTGAGLIGSLLVVLYGTYFYFTPGPHRFYTHDAGIRLVILASTAPAMALLVGLLRSRADQRAAARLQSAHRYSDTLLESMQDGLVAFDGGGRVLEVNGSFCVMTGFERQELIGTRPPLPYWPPEHVENIRPVFERYAAGGRGEYDLVFQRKNGERFGVTLAGAPISGERDGFVTTVKDATERRRWQQQLDEALQRLQAEVIQRKRDSEALHLSNQELDQFAYAASHDLKAPLRGIANLSQWIEEDMGERFTAEARAHMALLRGRVRRMELLIEGILQYSRIGRVEANVERVDVSLLLEEVIEMLGLAGRGVVEVVDPMPVAPAQRTRLQQVFMNLIGNGVKHGAPPRGDRKLQVKVGCRDAGEWYEFSVSDNGPGIPPEYHERIFQIFQTLSPRDQMEGAGIGLALVRKIVRLGGGDVWVESEPGRGAVFRFTWPAAKKDEDDG